MKTTRFLPACLLLASGLAMGPTLADWTLNNDRSALYFASIKKDTVVEVHHFDRLSGTIDAEGQATLDIDLNSVNTNIPIRDQRMRDDLFQTAEYPDATIRVDLGGDGIKDGEQEINATLKLHGAEKEITAKVRVSVTDDQIKVISTEPLRLSASDFGLDGGLARLAELAELPAISPTVPASFLLYYDRQP
ncbi:MAG: YceI family protein [Thiothrix sp.]|nr:YceI family protein [Thiothrix sp.]HPQ96091.1 YceI family protein [Thiolinea sp.]